MKEIFGAALAAQPPRPAVFILYFHQDSERLTDASDALVDDVLAAIETRGAFEVAVVGHTDTVGEAEYNYELSVRRAEEVRAILVARGADPAIIQVTSHGEENPLVPTEDEVPEPRNRRVEVTVR